MTRKSSPSPAHDVERLDDVGVADARGEARLVEEHRDELRDLCANCGCSRLIATVREKPTGPTRRPKWTVAIPPAAMRS